jgi:hypothetical protein
MMQHRADRSVAFAHGQSAASRWLNSGGAISAPCASIRRASRIRPRRSQRRQRISSRSRRPTREGAQLGQHLDHHPLEHAGAAGRNRPCRLMARGWWRRPKAPSRPGPTAPTLPQHPGRRDARRRDPRWRRRPAAREPRVRRWGGGVRKGRHPQPALTAVPSGCRKVARWIVLLPPSRPFRPSRRLQQRPSPRPATRSCAADANERGWRATRHRHR